MLAIPHDVDRRWSDFESRDERRACPVSLALSAKSSPVPRRKRSGLAPWQMAKSLAAIEAAFPVCPTVGELAQKLCLSPSHFGRGFRAGLGQSPHQYMVGRRIEHAKMLLLRTNDTLALIALACGFSDQAHFSRVFRDRTGRPPKAWRLQMKLWSESNGHAAWDRIAA